MNQDETLRTILELEGFRIKFNLLEKAEGSVKKIMRDLELEGEDE